jgi:hypothetical protein
VALAVTRAVEEWRAGRAPLPVPPALSRGLGILFTFHLVCAGWILFRSETFAKARLVFQKLAEGTTYHPNLDARVLAVLSIGLVSHFLPDAWYSAAKTGFCRLPAAAQAALLFGVLALLRTMASAEAVPFVYFQF